MLVVRVLFLLVTVVCKWTLSDHLFPGAEVPVLLLTRLAEPSGGSQSPPFVGLR